MFHCNIDFLAKRPWAYLFSSVLLLAAIVSLAVNGLRLGIDFTGGTLVEVGYQKPLELPVLRQVLASHGFGDAIVQHFGTTQDVLIRLKPVEGVKQAELSDRVLEVANQVPENHAELRRIEFVGPQVGDELAEDGGLALLYALIGILIYVAWRFEWKFAVGAVAALVHDVLITLGVFALWQWEFDLTVLAAILAVIGYSLNDTIVVFDRIRENFRKLRKGDSECVVNTSLNETLSRTLMTSFTTVLVLLALAFFGGSIIHNFALALLIGIFIGTYSSIYVASALTLRLGVSREDLLLPEKEGQEIDHLP